ncbi:MAG: GNAT family N-acetyltransferase [Anaerolineae bacterium]
MSEIITQLEPDQHEELLRFLERAFEQERGFFQREFPHWYTDPTTCTKASHVILSDGKIASHVGLYPIEVSADGVSLTVGGIGAVATAPEERGKGHMSRLLQYVIEVMRQRGYPLSWLGGDRQRYGTYGWEAAGLTYRLTFSKRSLDWTAVRPIATQLAEPEEAVPIVEALHRHATCWTRRPRLAQQLRAQNTRIWTCEDGYAIVRRTNHGRSEERLQILEMVSTSHREPRLIRTIIEASEATEAEWSLAACDQARLARLMPYAAHWRSGPDGMYRIVDPVRLLEAAKPYLRRWADALDGCSLCIAIQEHDRTTAVTLAFAEGDVQVTPTPPLAPAEQRVDLDILEATRLLLGGPPTNHETELPAGLLAALPLPMHIPPMDHI